MNPHLPTVLTGTRLVAFILIPALVGGACLGRVGPEFTVSNVWLSLVLAATLALLTQAAHPYRLAAQHALTTRARLQGTVCAALVLSTAALWVATAASVSSGDLGAAVWAAGALAASITVGTVSARWAIPLGV